MDNKNTKVICRKKFHFISNVNEKKEVEAILYQPQKINETEYTCLLRLEGYKHIELPATGIDPFQALTLSINLMRTLLSSYVGKGGKIFDEFENEVSVDLLLSC